MTTGWATSVVLGIVWALWHLPLFYLPGSGSDGQSFPIYLLHVMSLSIAFAWLYWKTEGSLLLVMLLHASVNNTTGIVPAAQAGASDPLSFSGSPMAWATLGVSWATAVLLLFAMRKGAIGMILDRPWGTEPERAVTWIKTRRG